MIPEVLHFVWLGSKLPEDEIKNISSWERHNPYLTIKIWTDKHISDLDFSEGAIKAFEAGDGIYAYQSDIMRQHIINKFGGFYSDTDIECHKPIPRDFFSKDYVFLKPHPKSNWLTNAFFGVHTNSDLITQITEGIVAKDKEEVNRRRCYIYGPQYFTKVIKDYTRTTMKYSVTDLPTKIKNSLVLDHWFWSRKNHERYCTHYAKASWRKGRPQ
jgi:mannosyltransferase OCH1-like enzyme